MVLIRILRLLITRPGEPANGDLGPSSRLASIAPGADRACASLGVEPPQVLSRWGILRHHTCCFLGESATEHWRIFELDGLSHAVALTYRFELKTSSIQVASPCFHHVKPRRCDRTFRTGAARSAWRTVTPARRLDS